MAEGDPKIGQLDSWRGDKIILSTPDVDVPVVYHADMSYYSQIVRLVLEEEGVQYISRGFDIHGDMEQMTQWYMNVNPSAVVPTLIYRGKTVVESRDISVFVVDEISSNGKLLPKSPERQAVVDLVDLHFKNCNIEQVSMSTLMLTNKLLAFGMPKKLKSGIAKFEKLKKENPDLENVIDKRIQHLHKRMKMFQNPLESKNEAMEPLEKVLDSLEKKLNETGSEFLCGANYTMADCLYTCMMARLNVVNLLDDQLKTKPKLALWWNRVQGRPSFKAAGLVKDPFSYSLAAKKMCTIL